MAMIGFLSTRIPAAQENDALPARDCMQAPSGLDILRMPIAADYWRVNELSVMIRRCHTRGACNSSAANAQVATSSRRRLTESRVLRWPLTERLCTPGHVELLLLTEPGTSRRRGMGF